MKNEIRFFMILLLYPYFDVFLNLFLLMLHSKKIITSFSKKITFVNSQDSHFSLKNLDELIVICRDYFDRMYQCESQKYDMEFECRKKDFEVWVEWNNSTRLPFCIFFKPP